MTFPQAVNAFFVDLTNIYSSSNAGLSINVDGTSFDLSSIIGATDGSFGIVSDRSATRKIPDVAGAYNGPIPASSSITCLLGKAYYTGTRPTSALTAAAIAPMMRI
jgi:hypothetical protein